jgi:sulfur carrier protein
VIPGVSIRYATRYPIKEQEEFTMEIKVNGMPQVIEEGEIDVYRLLELNEVRTPEMVAVQLNGQFVNQAAYAETRLKSNDEVEFLYFMGGGRG